MTVLCLLDTPNGNVIELSHEGDEFSTRLLTPDDGLTVTPEQARDWYETAKRCGAVICAPFPSKGR